ncbi:MAG TPA: mechanosensitive ion channel domain-containing protein, partial [Pyrinomonadaceae bacterium]
MTSLQLRRKLVPYLVVMIIATLALYLVNIFDESLRAYFVDGVAEDMRNAADVSYRNVIKIIYIVLWMTLAVVFIRGINGLIFSIGYRLRRGYEAPNLVRNTFSIVAYVIILFILLKWHYPTVDLGALFTTSAIFGVIIGLALQDTLGNLFAGISLQADKPFQVGDVITVGQWTGVVEEITWRGIKLRTFQNHIVLISNSQAGKESIEVAPRDNLNARLVFFNTLYTDSPARTIHVVREAVREADNVSNKITPIVRIRNLGDNGVDY